MSARHLARVGLLLLIVFSTAPLNGARHAEAAEQIPEPMAILSPAVLKHPAEKKAAAILDRIIASLHRVAEKQNIYNQNRKMSPLVGEFSQPRLATSPDYEDKRLQMVAVTHEVFAKVSPIILAAPQSRPKDINSQVTMELERRGEPQKSSRTFWRCYFNAVSCFGKK